MKLLHACDVSTIAVIVDTPKKPDNNHCDLNKGKEKVQNNICILAIKSSYQMFLAELVAVIHELHSSIFLSGLSFF
jgi:hypothetical protein